MSKELEALNTITAYGEEIDGEKLPITYKEYLEAYNIIEQALKRNEPMKVMLKDQGFEHYDAYCPKCKEYVGFKNSVRESLTCNYCPCCGQKLD